MKLERKMLLLLVPIIVAPLVTVGWVAYKQLRTEVEDNYLREMAATVREVDALVQSRIETTAANTALFATSFLVEKYALTTDEEQRYSLLQRPLLRLFANYQRNFPEYHELRFILPDGYEAARRVSWEMGNVTEEELGSPLLAALDARESGVHTEIAINPNTRRLALYAGMALRLRDTSVDPLLAPLITRGYFVVTASLDFLREQINLRRFGKDGRLVLVDSTGLLHMHHHNGHGRLHQAEQAEVLRFPDLDMAALRGSLDEPRLITLSTRGEDVYATGAEIQPGLFLFAMLPAIEVEQATTQLRNLVALVTVATILVFGVLLFGLLRWLVVRPLGKLDLAAHEIGRGRLDVRVDVAGDDEIGRLGRSFAAMADSLAQSHEQVRYLAYHDGLTGLPNRNMFKEYLAKSLARARRNDEQLALLFLDMDEFKQVNDTLGHEAGDKLLGMFSDALAAVLREGDLIGRGSDPQDDLLARLGGDEFIILLQAVAGPEEAAAAAARILEMLSRPFPVEGQQFYIGASIGITMFPQDGTGVDELIKHADLAMYAAKRRGKNNYQFFMQDMNVLAQARVRLEQRLRQAVENGDFELHYQPIMRIGHDRCEGVEALVRWRDEQSGELIMPDDFIPMAESTGLIIPIGTWVIEEACRQGAAWQSAGLPELKISINASSLQLGHPGLPSLIERVLGETGLRADLLNLEMTETSIMSSGEQTMKVLERIKALGVSIALDDFGTGFSSLSYVRQFPIDHLKIDRSFVRDCVGNENQRSIVAAIIAMAHALDLEVVGEGVETPGELDFLQQLGCDLVQGFLWGRPLTADELEAFLRELAISRSPYSC